MTTYYTKQGRRYVPAIHAEPWGHNDAMKPGQARLVTCAPDGMRRYTYDVTPDAAAVVAALDLAELAMMESMNKAAGACKVMDRVTMPPKCRKLAAELAAALSKARVTVPPWWSATTSATVAAEARKALEAAVQAQPQPVPADPKPDYDDVGKGPWRDGPPPSVGWWPASGVRFKNFLRWFDGSGWSSGVNGWMSAEEAARMASLKDNDLEKILWRDRADWWPERSRT
jgi:hypothetical protein